MSIHETLSKIQREIRVPKGRDNKFSGFKYRSCEDILEEVKKIMPSDACLTLRDDIVMVGDRHYIKSTAVLNQNDAHIAVYAYAREPLSKKGFDEAQITGAASSYARKYALSGLFCIDDSADVDSFDNSKPEFKPEASKVPSKIAPQALITSLVSLADNFGATEEQRKRWLGHFKVNRFSDLSETDANRLFAMILDKMSEAVNNSKPGDVGKPSNFVNGG